MAAAIDALIPVRALAAAKERLAALLSRHERRTLARAMLGDVLAAALATPELRRIWIVTADDEAAAAATAGGAQVLPEVLPEGASPLNGALEGARTLLCARSDPPDALLVLPLDIPAATPEALSSFLHGAPGSGGKLVRICPARDGGTNALLLRPPKVVPFRFGVGSAGAHARAGIAAGAVVTLRPHPLLQDDVDTPADIERLLRGGRTGPLTRDALREMRLTERMLRLAARDAAL